MTPNEYSRPQLPLNGADYIAIHYTAVSYTHLDIEDIIVSEYGTTVVGLEMMRAVHEENAEEDRKKQVVKSAFNTLRCV